MEEKTEIEIDELILKQNSKTLILFNDEINEFNHVVECLMEYCNHSMYQAEQCTHIVHYKGKYSIKSGAFDELQPIYEALSDNKLTVEIQ